MIWNAVATVISAVFASVLVVFLLPPMSEAVEFLVWMGFFAASAWLLDRVIGHRFRPPPRA